MALCCKNVEKTEKRSFFVKKLFAHLARVQGKTGLSTWILNTLFFENWAFFVQTGPFRGKVKKVKKFTRRSAFLKLCCSVCPIYSWPESPFLPFFTKLTKVEKVKRVWATLSQPGPTFVFYKPVDQPKLRRPSLRPWTRCLDSRILYQIEALSILSSI